MKQTVLTERPTVVLFNPLDVLNVESIVYKSYYKRVKITTQKWVSDSSQIFGQLWKINLKQLIN